MCPSPNDYFDLYKPGDSQKSPESPQTPESPVTPATPATPAPPESPTAPSGEPFARPTPENSLRNRTVRAVLGVLKALGYLAIYFAVSFLVVLIFGLIWRGKIAAQTDDLNEASALLSRMIDENSMLLTAVVNAVLICVLTLILFLRRKNALSRRQNLGLVNRVRPGRLALLFGIGLSAQYAVIIPLGILQQLLPQKYVDSYMQTQDLYLAGGLPLYLLSAVILAPILEELLFRGLVATRLTRAMPAFAAVLLTATLFGVMHGSLYQGLYAGLLGVLLGAVFFRENSLFASIVLHFGFNLASLPAYLIQQNEQLMNSATVGLLLSLLSWLSIPIFTVLMIVYFALMKKTPRDPAGPEVNAWLMRE